MRHTRHRSWRALVWASAMLIWLLFLYLMIEGMLVISVEQGWISR
jgi:hypothetical protein